LADDLKAGKLNKARTMALFGLMSQAQAGQPLDKHTLSLATPAPTMHTDDADVTDTKEAGGGGTATLKGAVDQLFEALTPDSTGCLSGQQLMPIMTTCDPALSQTILRSVWGLADDAKAGKLNKARVMKLFGLMSQAQSGQAPNPRGLNLATPPPKMTATPGLQKAALSQASAAAAAAAAQAAAEDDCMAKLDAVFEGSPAPAPAPEAAVVVEEPAAVAAAAAAAEDEMKAAAWVAAAAAEKATAQATAAAHTKAGGDPV
jgi:hypothetical protein